LPEKGMMFALLNKSFYQAMQKLLTIAVLATGLISGMRATAQEKGEDKSKRPSPPAKISQK